MQPLGPGREQRHPDRDGGDQERRDRDAVANSGREADEAKRVVGRAEGGADGEHQAQRRGENDAQLERQRVLGDRRGD